MNTVTLQSTIAGKGTVRVNEKIVYCGTLINAYQQYAFYCMGSTFDVENDLEFCEKNTENDDEVTACR